MENIICVIANHTDLIGWICWVHTKCEIIGKQGGVNKYRCLCCGDEFLGGINGAKEWAELPSLKEVNYILCTESQPSIKWYLRQIRAHHHKYCHQEYSYKDNMQPLLKATCDIFGLKPNDWNFENLIDAALNLSIHKDIQKLIDEDHDK